MATAKVKVYPYVSLDHKGNRTGVKAQAYPGEDSVTEQAVYLHLAELEIDVNIPDDEALRAAAVQVIDARMQDARAKFMAQQTLMQSIKNDLLRLEHADVLDAEPMRGRPVDADGALDDGIPF